MLLDWNVYFTIEHYLLMCSLNHGFWIRQENRALACKFAKIVVSKFFSRWGKSRTVPTSPVQWYKRRHLQTQYLIWIFERQMEGRLCESLIHTIYQLEYVLYSTWLTALPMKLRYKTLLPIAFWKWKHSSIYWTVANMVVSVESSSSPSIDKSNSDTVV